MDEEYKDLNELFRSIGHYTVQWAMLEQCLDFCVAVIYQNCGGREMAPQIPRSLSLKSGFLRKAFNRMPALAPQRNTAIDVLDRVSTLKDYRHNLIHAALKSMTSTGGRFPFDKIDYEPHWHRVRRVTFDFNSFPKQLALLANLAGDTASLAMWLVENHGQPRLTSRPPPIKGLLSRQSDSGSSPPTQ